MKSLAILFLLALACSPALRAEGTTSPDTIPYSSEYVHTNDAMLMAVTDTMSTTTIPRCKKYELQLVRGSGGSIRFNSQGGTVTASTGGIELTTGALYHEDGEISTRISAIVSEGAAAMLVIVLKR